MKQLNEQTDEQLVSSYLNGNNVAFDTLLRRYERKVFTYIAYSVKNEEVAQDLFQDCFMRIITKLHSGLYTENGKFASWVMRIAHNLIIDYHRQNQSLVVFSNDEAEYDLLNDSNIALEYSREKEIIDKQVLQDVKALIKKLPANQREVVLMRFYEGLSFKDIADTTGVSINTALGRMRYALINLRRLAEKFDVCMAGEATDSGFSEFHITDTFFAFFDKTSKRICLHNRHILLFVSDGGPLSGGLSLFGEGKGIQEKESRTLELHAAPAVFFQHRGQDEPMACRIILKHGLLFSEKTAEVKFPSLHQMCGV